MSGALLSVEQVALWALWIGLGLVAAMAVIVVVERLGQLAHERTVRRLKRDYNSVIDRALGGALASSRQAYASGLAALDRYARSARGKPFKDLPLYGRLVGYAGPPDRQAAEVVSKYVIVDMYAKAIQGMPAEDAAKWAHSEVAKAHA